MGVNTLAFRLPQHNTFYHIDADCVGIFGMIPWEKKSSVGRRSCKERYTTVCIRKTWSFESGGI